MKSKIQLIKIATGMVVAAACGAAGAVTLTDNGPVGTTTYFSINGGATKSYAPDRKFNDGTSNFTAYCIDPGTTYDSTTNYSTTSLDNFLTGGAASSYASEITRAGYSGLPLSTTVAVQAQVLSDLKELFSWAYNDSQLNATKAAAFGMAVWEIILQDGGAAGTTYARASGTLKSFGSTSGSDNDAVELQTNSYLTALDGGASAWTTLLGSSASQTNWTYTVYYDTTSPFSQNFLRVTGPSVPEPGTAALVALALFGAVRVTRRKPQA